jgi:drug/metabolite transporter (DMT)-like permease
MGSRPLFPHGNWGYYDSKHRMSSSLRSPGQKAVAASTIILAFLTVYFFWGSTYTAIRIGSAQMPALLLAGVRFPIAGLILLGWCRSRGLRLFWPVRSMLILGLVGFLLLGVSNVLLIYAERTVPSGLSSLVFAITPLYVAIMELLLPKGEPLSPRGWLGLLLGFGGLVILLWPSLQIGLSGNPAALFAIGALLFGAFAWAVGSVVSRHAHLQVNIFVAASWQMLIAGLISLVLGTVLGQWPQFHVNTASIGSLAWLITGGSLLGYTAFIFLLGNVPVAKVMSYTYVNPVVAVLLGIFLLHERPAPAEYIGMATIVVAVYLMTTTQAKGKAGQPIEELEQLPAE